MLTERCPIVEFQPGDKFERLMVAVRTVRGGIDKNGKPFADVKIADWSGSRAAKIWKVTESEINALTKVDFLEITGIVDNSEHYSGQFTINRYAIAPVPDDIAEFLERPRATNKEYRDRFLKLIKSVGDTELRTTLRQVFGDEPFRRKFFRAYAASSVHHAFPGGLLEHTVEVAELCSGACDVLNGLDRDLLVAGALVHDIGKMDEMNQELHAGEYTDDGCLIGHIVLGAVTVSRAIANYNATVEPETRISPATERALTHLILSHHGIPDHGAARKPAFAEAMILYLCDNISAKSRQFMDLVAQNTVGATSASNRFLDTQVYLKPIRENAAQADDVDNTLDFAVDEAGADKVFVAAVTLPILELATESANQASRPQTSEWRRVVPPPGGADYVLRAPGGSQVDGEVQGGDLLFVLRQETASDGDIVIVDMPGEGQSVKRLRLNDKREHAIEGPYLEAMNPVNGCGRVPMRPDVRILGKATGLLRDF